MKNALQTLVLIAALGLVANAEPSSPEPQYDHELNGFDYPFEVSSYELASQNQKLEMRYMDVGEQSSEKVIVLLHGKNFSGYYWERIAKDLVEKGYRVIIPDQIGFGKSSKPKAYQYSLASAGPQYQGTASESQCEEVRPRGPFDGRDGGDHFRRRLPRDGE